MKSFNRYLDTRHPRQLGRWHAGVSFSLLSKCYRANFLHRSVITNFKSVFPPLLPSLFFEPFSVSILSIYIKTLSFSPASLSFKLALYKIIHSAVKFFIHVYFQKVNFFSELSIMAIFLFSTSYTFYAV
jgi:hypothetical protein